MQHKNSNRMLEKVSEDGQKERGRERGGESENVGHSVMYNSLHGM